MRNFPSSLNSISLFFPFFCVGVCIHNEALVLISTVSYFTGAICSSYSASGQKYQSDRRRYYDRQIIVQPSRLSTLTFSPYFKESISITKCKQTATNNRDSKRNISLQVTSPIHELITWYFLLTST